ncbi:Hypothetical predicted protein [Cloeon dipterum]|uniref:Uncharacterized protein n=1 Tax=Cloeon dipterum TaxID=197152 RepID=A0A8S1E0C1_9INSE|nr:Hypothetical predicted protein [Cloeon dipterum]
MTEENVWTEVTENNLEKCNARTPDSWGQKVPGYVRRDTKMGYFVDIEEFGVFSPPEFELLNPNPQFRWHLKKSSDELPSNAFLASTGYPGGNFYIGIVQERGSWLPGVVNDKVLFVAMDDQIQEFKRFYLLSLKGLGRKRDQFHLQPPNPTTRKIKMPIWILIDSEETLESYQQYFTLLNPILYPATYFWYRQHFITGYYDSANQRGLFAYKINSGEDLSATIYDYNCYCLWDQENVLKWKQYQKGDLTDGRAFPAATDRNGRPVYFGRVKFLNCNPIGQVCEDGFCYVPTHQNGVIRVSEFEILVFRDNQKII